MPATRDQAREIMQRFRASGMTNDEIADNYTRLAPTYDLPSLESLAAPVSMPVETPTQTLPETLTLPPVREVVEGPRGRVIHTERAQELAQAVGSQDIPRIIESGALFKPRLPPLAAFGDPELQEEAARRDEEEVARKNLRARTLKALTDIGDPIARSQLRAEIQQATTTPPSATVEAAKRLGAGAVYGAVAGLGAPGRGVRGAMIPAMQGRWGAVGREAREAFLGQREASPAELRETFARETGLSLGMPKAEEGALGVIGQTSADVLAGLATDPLMALKPVTSSAQFLFTVNKAMTEAGAAKPSPGVLRMLSELGGEPGGFDKMTRIVGRLAEKGGGDAGVARETFKRLAGPEGVYATRQSASVAGLPSVPLTPRAQELPWVGRMFGTPERTQMTERVRQAAGVGQEALGRAEARLPGEIQALATAFAPLSAAERERVFTEVIGPRVWGVAQATGETVGGEARPFIDPLQRGAAQMLHRQFEARMSPDAARAARTFERLLGESFARLKATGHSPGEAANIVSQRYDPRLIRAEIERARPLGTEAEATMATSWKEPRSPILREQIPPGAARVTEAMHAARPAVPTAARPWYKRITDEPPELMKMETEPVLAGAARLRDVGRETALREAENVLAREWGETAEAMGARLGLAPSQARRPTGIDRAQFTWLRHPDTGEQVGVPNEISNRLDRVFRSFDKPALGRLGRVYDAYLSAQRQSATLPAPVYHTQNVTSDLIDAAREDLPPGPFARAWNMLRGKTAPRDVVATQKGTNSPLHADTILREAMTMRKVQAGPLGAAGFTESPGSMREAVRAAGVDVPREAGEWARAAWTLGPLGKAGRRLAQGEANWVRLSAYLHYRTEGLSMKLAARAVDRLYPDVLDVSDPLRWARKAILFPTWQALHVPITARQVAQRPGRFTAAETLRQAWNQRIGEEEGRPFEPGEVPVSVAEGMPWRLPRAATPFTEMPVVVGTRTPEQDIFAPLGRAGLPAGGALGMLVPPAGAALGLATGKQPYSGAPIDDPLSFLATTLGPIGATRWLRAAGVVPEEFRTLPINEQWDAVRRWVPFLLPVRPTQVSAAKAAAERRYAAEGEELGRHRKAVKVEKRRARLLREPLTPRPQP